jgi:SAM-dependent methyltransferase
VLDAGSEEGILSTMLARRHPTWTVVAVDRNFPALRRGFRWGEGAGIANVHFICAELTRSLGVEHFDAALAIECLAEVPDDGKALRALFDALRPGGVLLTHTPVTGWQPVLPGSIRSYRRAVRRGYAPDEVVRKLHDAGFVVDELRPTFRSVVHLAQELMDRAVRSAPLFARLAALPILVFAVRLERAGVTWGASRALLVQAHRPSTDQPTPTTST